MTILKESLGLGKNSEKYLFYFIFQKALKINLKINSSTVKSH